MITTPYQCPQCEAEGTRNKFVFRDGQVFCTVHDAESAGWQEETVTHHPAQPPTIKSRERRLARRPR